MQVRILPRAPTGIRSFSTDVTVVELAYTAAREAALHASIGGSTPPGDTESLEETMKKKRRR